MDFSIVDILTTIVSNAFYVAVLLILFGLTIFVHELGHFLVAFRFKMVIDVFSLGFGHAIWKKKIKGVLFKIGWIPLGGYVALPQLDPTGMSQVQGKQGPEDAGQKTEDGTTKTDEKAEENKAEEGRVLPDISPWKKILVAFAGSFGNILFAILIAWFIYLNPLSITNDNAALIGYVEKDTDAFKAGLTPGDEIVEVNGKKVGSWYEYVVECVLKHKDNKEAELVIKSRDGIKTVKLPVVVDKENHRYGVPGVHPADMVAVSKVDQDSPCAGLGLKKSDIVRSVDGEKIDSMVGFSEILKKKEGQEVKLLIERGNKQWDVNIKPSFKSVGVIGVLFVVKDGKSTGEIDEVIENTPASTAGLKAGDMIKSVNGAKVESVSAVIRENAGATVNLVVERAGSDLAVDVVPSAVKRLDCGIEFGEITVTPWMQYRNPWKQLQNDASQIFRILKALVTPSESGSAARELGGPVMILTTLWLSIKLSMLNALGFIRFINVNLAIVNLLPIPVLDGGHIVFSLWEGITRRRVNPRLVNGLINFFAFLLIGLILIITFRDVLSVKNIFGKKKAKAEAAAPVNSGSVTNK